MTLTAAAGEVFFFFSLSSPSLPSSGDFRSPSVGLGGLVNPLLQAREDETEKHLRPEESKQL
jgi:hypothetical protein